MIDIPNLIRETGDKVEITEWNETRIVFLIERPMARWKTPKADDTPVRVVPAKAGTQPPICEVNGIAAPA